jgi:hypothetical protein
VIGLRERVRCVLGAAAAIVTLADASSWAQVKAFGPGEEATYSIDYGVINAGEGTFSVLDMIEYEGSHCYHFRTRARSNRFFSAVYRVRDQADSFMDADSLYTRYFDKRLREGDFRRDVEIHFDQKNHKAYFPDGSEDEIEPHTQDVLSAFFRVRTMDLEPGMEFEMPTRGDKEMYPLRVKVLRREEQDTELFGRIQCLVVQPYLDDDGLFKHEGDLLLWMTDDERKLPVRMRANVPVGAIEATLKSYRPPHLPLPEER